MNNIRLKVGLFVVIMIGVLGYVPGLLPFRINKDLVAEWCVVAFIAVHIKNRYLGLFLLWTFASVVMNCYTPVVGLNKAFIITSHTVFFFIMFYDVLYRYFKEIDLKMVFDIIASMVIVNCLMVLLQHRGIWPGIVPLNYKALTPIAIIWKYSKFPIYCYNIGYFANVTGLLDNINTTSALMAIGLPLFFRRRWLCLLPIVLMCLWITNSLGGILPAVVITILYLVYKFRYKAVALLTLPLGFLGYYLFKHETLASLLSFSNRLSGWQVGYEIIVKKWIVGWGIGQSSYLWRIVSQEAPELTSRLINFHNEYMNLTIELGVVGLVIIMGYICNLLYRLFKRLRTEDMFILFLGMLAGLMNIFVHFTMHGAVGIVLLIYFCMADKITGDDYGYTDHTNN